MIRTVIVGLSDQSLSINIYNHEAKARLLAYRTYQLLKFVSYPKPERILS